MSEQLKDKTAKGFLWGALNNGVMQLLNAVFGVVLGRILSQEDYGLIGMMVIFTSIATSLQDSGFVSALTNRRNATHEDYNSVFWFNITVSAALYVLFFLSSPLLAAFYEEPLLTDLFRYYSLGFFAASFSIVPRAILFKDLRQKELAIISITALVVSGTVGIAMAFNGMAYWGLATQNMVYTAMVSVLSWIFSGWRPTLTFTLSPIKEMFGFSCRMLITNIFHQVNSNIFSVVLGKLYTKSEVGYYNQANKWNIMGSSVIMGMVHGTAQPTFVKAGDDPQRLCTVFSKMLRFTAFVSFPTMLGMSLVAPEFITILITDKWLPSAHLMQILCVAGAFAPISQLYLNMVVSRGRSELYMYNIMAQGILTLIAILVIHHLGGSITQMVWAYVAIVVVWVAVWHFFVYRLIRLSPLQALRDILPFFFFAVATMLTTYYITSDIHNVYLLLTSRVIIAATIYIGIMWISGAKILRETIGYIVGKKV